MLPRLVGGRAGARVVIALGQAEATLIDHGDLLRRGLEVLLLGQAHERADVHDLVVADQRREVALDLSAAIRSALAAECLHALANRSRPCSCTSRSSRRSSARSPTGSRSAARPCRASRAARPGCARRATRRDPSSSGRSASDRSSRSCQRVLEEVRARIRGSIDEARLEARRQRGRRGRQVREAARRRRRRARDSDGSGEQESHASAVSADRVGRDDVLRTTAYRGPAIGRAAPDVHALGECEAYARERARVPARAAACGTSTPAGRRRGGTARRGSARRAARRAPRRAPDRTRRVARSSRTTRDRATARS